MKKLFWMRIINDPEKKDEKTIWKTIPDIKIDQKEIEDAFSDQRAATFDPAKSLAENVIKEKIPEKKQYFTPEESKSIQMSVSKLPKTDVLKEAL